LAEYGESAGVFTKIDDDDKLYKYIFF
jgi:hypothetical protein